MERLKPQYAVLVTLCLLVPLNSAIAKSIDVHYCDKNAGYTVKVSRVEITPFPVARGKETTFTVSLSTDREILGGIIKIEISYFGFHVHSESHELCRETLCPVTIGDFVLSQSIVLPMITPPGSYAFRMHMEDGNKKQLTCITFDFSIGFLPHKSDI